MSRSVRKLFDLEIDEVSVVDRPANQHGLIAIAKNDGDLSEEDQMPKYVDADGQAIDIDVDELEPGEHIFDVETGEEFVFEPDDEPADEQSGELAGVGKANPFQVARAGFNAGVRGSKAPGMGQNSLLAGAAHVGRNRYRYGAGAAAAGGAAAGLAASRVGKADAGKTILEELSKAVNQGERDQIIAKALRRIEDVESQNIELAKALDEERDERMTEAFIAKAAEYNLPVDAEVLGPILKAAATVLTDEQLDVLDTLFNAVGDVLYEEVGYVGDTSNGSVLDVLNGHVGELVGKADVSTEVAFTELMASNPSLYDAYLAENGR